MLHTVQLRRFLTKEIFESILRDKQYEFRYQKGKGYFTDQYVDIGINIIKIKKYSRPEVTYYYIDFIINLNLFINANDISEGEIRQYRNTALHGNVINSVLIYSMYAELLKIFPLLNMSDSTRDCIITIENEPVLKWEVDNHYAFYLYEIDYLYDIPSPFVKTYIKLLNYGHQPSRIKRIKHEHEEGEDNLYELNGSIKINTYDKEREILERFGDEEDAKKHQVLRVEVGLKKRKLSTLVSQDKYSKLEERTLFDFADIDIGYEMVTKYMRQRCYRGDYYDYNTAMLIIDSNDKLKPSMKMKLKAVLEGVKNYHGVDKYIEHAVADGKKEATIKGYIKRLEELGINPITISKRDKDAYPLPNGGRFLPSILTMIDIIYGIEKDNRDHSEKVIELMDK